MIQRRPDDQPPATEGDRSDQERELFDELDEDTAAAVPEDVDPADAQEQRQHVPYDEDDYR